MDSMFDKDNPESVFSFYDTMTTEPVKKLNYLECPICHDPEMMFVSHEILTCQNCGYVKNDGQPLIFWQYFSMDDLYKSKQENSWAYKRRYYFSKFLRKIIFYVANAMPNVQKET